MILMTRTAYRLISPMFIFIVLFDLHLSQIHDHDVIKTQAVRFRDKCAHHLREVRGSTCIPLEELESRLKAFHVELQQLEDARHVARQERDHAMDGLKGMLQRMAHSLKVRGIGLGAAHRLRHASSGRGRGWGGGRGAALLITRFHLTFPLF